MKETNTWMHALFSVAFCVYYCSSCGEGSGSGSHSVCICYLSSCGVNQHYLSRLPPKSVPLVVQAAFGGRRHRYSSHLDPLFIFHLFCLVFLHTWFSFPSLSVVYSTLCSPSCLCVELFVVSACAHVYWCASGFAPMLVLSLCRWFLTLNCSGYYLVLLSCVWLHCHQLGTPLHDLIGISKQLHLTIVFSLSTDTLVCMSLVGTYCTSIYITIIAYYLYSTCMSQSMVRVRDIQYNGPFCERDCLLDFP
jgi:hypothetical protein